MYLSLHLTHLTKEVSGSVMGATQLHCLEELHSAF